jgi:sec-independent protein translocase protein TatC
VNGGELPPDPNRDYTRPDDPATEELRDKPDVPATGGNLPPEVIPPAAVAGGGGYRPPPPPDDEDEDDQEDRGMLRMSFMEHLEELRDRIIRALVGFGVAFLLCIIFANQIWNFVRQPATAALIALGVNPPNLAQITPMEAFSTIWMKIPLVVSLFIAAPWVLWQLWAFISPGLYEKEKRLAVPFVFSAAILFLLGGLFAYFVAFRYGLTFLLGIGIGYGVTPVVSISEYSDLFVNVILGVALVFELPVVIFLLTLLRIASPSFLLSNSRYAILAIVIVAAIVTPTPDVFNLMLFAVPMTLLFFLGVFASYVLVLRRENRKFPWKALMIWVFSLVIILAIFGVILIQYYHLHFVRHWPFWVK